MDERARCANCEPLEQSLKTVIVPECGCAAGEVGRGDVRK